MPAESLLIFDPRRTMHVQGFSGRAATTTLHDATETGVSISGIFQAAEDFAVLALYNAYDYFNHLRLKPLPRTDLSGLKLEFDLEYDHPLDGVMRFDANKYPSVSWDSVTFVCGAGDIYEVRLLDHATAVAGSETPATCRLDAYGTWPTSGLDWLHLYFRDTRYTVASDQVEGTAYDALLRLAQIINTTGAAVEGRYGPDQSAVITASVIHTGPAGAPSAALVLTFAAPPLPAARYGKLGNLDRVLVTSGHQGVGGQNLDWTGPRNRRFTGGDNDTRYRITLDFTQPLLDKLGRTVPMNDCRKIYIVLAPRFEPTEEELEDGGFLTSSVGPGDIVWQVDDSSKLTGGRYFIGTPDGEERVRLIALNSGTLITVERGFQSSTPGSWAASARMKKLSPMTGFAADVEWRCTISNLAVTGDRSLKVGGGAPRIEESDGRCKYTGTWESYAYNAGWPTQWWSMGHAKRTTSGQVTIRYSYRTSHVRAMGDQAVTGMKTFLDGLAVGFGTKAATGLVRLPNAGAMKWRNSDDSGDLGLSLGANDHLKMDAVVDFAPGQTFGALFQQVRSPGRVLCVLLCSKSRCATTDCSSALAWGARAPSLDPPSHAARHCHPEILRINVIGYLRRTGG